MPRTRREKEAAGNRSREKEKEAAATGSSGEMLPASSEETLQRRAAASIAGVPMVHRGEGEMVSGASAISSDGMPSLYPGEGAVDRGLHLLKKATFSSRGSAALVALHRAEDREECAAKHPTKKPRTVMIPQTHCTEDKPDIGLSEAMLQKQSSKVEAVASLSGEIHAHPLKEADTAKDLKESDSNEIVHGDEENKEVQEADLLIQNLNVLGLGEDISVDEFSTYFHELPYWPPVVDSDRELTIEELDEQDVLHAKYRLISYKHKVKEEGMEDTLGLKDISQDECDLQFCMKWDFFMEIEENWPLGWYFHPDYCQHASLDDYQRLVLRNYGGTEYSKWSEYHGFLHSHVIESEYVNYCKELFKQLKWMEDYLDAPRKSYKWDRISSRGAFLAMKIAATKFHKISGSLAYYGYHECTASMGYDLTWFKELDGVYFEVWRRVTKEKMSFREALEEVYNLNKFPLRQRRMKVALEREYNMKKMETEYHFCTKAITLEVKEDRVQELIAEAVRKLVNKPKTYEQYIRKKIQIACVVGILTPQDFEAAV